MAVSQEMLDEWLAHPVTREFAARLRRQRQSIMEQWANGNFIRETEFQTAVVGAAAHRHALVLNTLLDLEPEDFEPNE